MARQELTAANVAASRARRRAKDRAFKKRQKKLISQATGKRKKERIREAERQEAEQRTATQAAARRETEAQAAAKVKFDAAKAASEQKKAEAAKARPTPAAVPAAAAVPAPEEKAKGWANVLAVFTAPLQKDVRVVATTDNRVFNTAAEYVANHPFATALIMTGAIRVGIGALKTGISRGVGAGVGTGVATNTKTAKQSATLIAGVLANMKKPLFVLGAIGAMIGTYPWAEWAGGEALEIMGFSTSKAIATGDPELIQLARDTTNEITDPELWEKIGRLIPGANIVVGFNKKAKAIFTQAKINDKLMADALIQLETGETDDAKWARVREEQAAQDKAAIDYYNEQRKLQLQWEEEAADRDMKEDARFWATEREKQREREAEDRQAIADFWNAYRKTQAKFAADNRPSNLNFGLL